MADGHPTARTVGNAEVRAGREIDTEKGLTSETTATAGVEERWPALMEAASKGRPGRSSRKPMEELRSAWSGAAALGKKLGHV
jgi:hypothetical protein